MLLPTSLAASCSIPALQFEAASVVVHCAAVEERHEAITALTLYVCVRGWFWYSSMTFVTLLCTAQVIDAVQLRLQHCVSYAHGVGWLIAYKYPRWQTAISPQSHATIGHVENLTNIGLTDIAPESETWLQPSLVYCRKALCSQYALKCETQEERPDSSQLGSILAAVANDIARWQC